MPAKPLGVCPFCESDVPRYQTIIEYENGVFAECPECEEVVDPTQ